MITSVLVQWVPAKFEKRLTLFVAMVGYFIGLLLMGPSQVLHFKESITSMAFGQAFIGSCSGFTLVICLPEMVNSVLPFFPQNE